MLLPAYDSHGRLYYPQYEEPKLCVEKVSVKETKLLDASRPTKTRTRSHSPCIDDSLNAFCYQRQKQQHSMAVKEHKSLHWSVSKDLPTPALDPIPRWTNRSVKEKRDRNMDSVGGHGQRSRSRDIAGSKPREKKGREKGAEHHNVLIEAPLVTPPPLDPSTASDYSAFTDIITPDSTYGLESRPHSYASSSFKPTKQFFASANTSTASLLSQTAPASSPKKFRRSSLFPPDGPEEYPVRGLCPHLQVLLMSGGKKASRTAIQHDRTTRYRLGPVVNRVLSPATSPPIMPINECDPLVTEIRSALETVMSLQMVMDSSYLARMPRLDSNRGPNMVIHGKVDGVKPRRESTPPIQRQTSDWKGGKDRWGCGCIDHGFD
ncbi:hypothetical protein QFC21_002343 [Naganishia friedmannii]|uniref:Uncharacterized protein n=1 Tax=Naganishia friedmannii TaxID=89922 RepID=A0ACC2VXP9_9TREE|nr:hypothetical protein QFC21_002343 [Naganishia friedmannii]